MFRKCLRYDLRAVGKLWWIAAVSVLALAAPVGLCYRYEQLHSYEPNHYPWGTAGILLGYVTAIAFVIITFVLLFVRYYGNFFRDEGYLTFTLPVKRKTLFASKVLSGFFWKLATTAVIVTAGAIVMALVPVSEDEPTSVLVSFLVGMGEFLKEGHETIGWWLTVYIVEIVCFSLLSTLSEVLMMYFAITMGSAIARKHKLITTIGLFYGAGAASSVLKYIGYIFLILWIACGTQAFPDTFFTDATVKPLLMLMLLLLNVMLAVVNVVLSFVTLGTLERKLNLA